MYGLPQDTDLTAFIGCELDLVSIGLHQVNLSFDRLRGIGMTVEGHYAVSGPSQAQTRYSAAPAGAGALVALLGSRVTDAQVFADGTTTVLFADRGAVTIYDSEAHYESYQIYIGERIIVV
jgi:hypothetical protein